MWETTGQPRYPETVLYAFKGFSAFELYGRITAPLAQAWCDSFSEEERQACFLLVSIKSTVSKAMLRLPEELRRIRRRSVRLHFYSPKGPVHGARAMSQPHAKKCLRLCRTTPDNLIPNVPDV
jgi:hypothetical protein